MSQYLLPLALGGGDPLKGCRQTGGVKKGGQKQREHHLNTKSADGLPSAGQITAWYRKQ